MIEVYGKEVPSDIAEIVQARHTALLVIDMQNDFCSADGSSAMCGADLSMYKEMIPRIVVLVDACREKGIPIIHAKMVALPHGASDSVAWIRMRMRASGDPEGSRNRVWAFTVEGTWGADFVPELTPAPEDIIVEKFRSSAFYETNLDLVLRSKSIKTLLVCGCTTEGCVESTVRDAGFHDYLAVVVSDCVGSDVPELHIASMLVMSAYRADVINATDVARLLRDSATPGARGVSKTVRHA